MDTFYIPFSYLAAPTKKKEGEECGPCFNPTSNFDCGTCEDGLECIKEEPIPDAPGRCERKFGTYTMIWFLLG